MAEAQELLPGAPSTSGATSSLVAGVPAHVEAAARALHERRHPDLCWGPTLGVGYLEELYAEAEAEAAAALAAAAAVAFVAAPSTQGVPGCAAAGTQGHQRGGGVVSVLAPAGWINVDADEGVGDGDHRRPARRGVRRGHG